jgi:hypothetical protein
LTLQIQRASFKDLPLIYDIYFEAFGQSPLQVLSLSESGKRIISKLSILRTISTHFFHIAIERVFFASQSGDVTSLMRSSIDMIPLKITSEAEIIGFCFLKKHNSAVFEVGIIGIKKNKRGLGLGVQALNLIKQQAIEMGASRLIVRASGSKKVVGFFVKSGFRPAFSEEILFFDIKD